MRAKTRLFPCVVLASLRGSTYRSVRLVSRSLRLCLGLGASLGEEAVLADSGRAGEVAAGVGRVRCLAFLSILLGAFLLSQMCESVKLWRAHIGFLQSARRGLSSP